MHKDIIYYICVILSLSVLAWDQSDWTWESMVEFRKWMECVECLTSRQKALVGYTEVYQPSWEVYSCLSITWKFNPGMWQVRPFTAT